MLRERMRFTVRVPAPLLSWSVIALCMLPGCGRSQANAAISAGAGGAANGGSPGTAGGAGAAIVPSFHWLEPPAVDTQRAEQMGTVTSLRTAEARASVDASVVAANASVVSGDDTLSFNDAFRWTATTGSVSLGSPVGLAPAWRGTLITDMNANGSVIVGIWAGSDGNGGFRWTESGGVQALVAPNGATVNEVDQVSADGSVLLGALTTATGHTRAFRWTADAGAVEIGALEGDTDSSPTWLSPDGSIVIGSSSDGASGQPFRWTAATGSEGLGLLPGTSFCSPQALLREATGAVIIGLCDAGAQPFRWTEATGMKSIGALPGYSTYEPWSVSSDGAAITGDATAANDQAEVFYWKEGAGMVGLGFLQGDDSSSSRPVSGISADGVVVAGQSIQQGAGRGFRWTQSSGMVALPPLPGHNQSSLSSMSANGAVCAGSSELRQPGMDLAAGPDAVVWDAAGNVSSLVSVFAARGVDIGPGAPIDVAVSRDGATLLGLGHNAQGELRAFVARLP
jgi:probable HAF family extracellular repeat protein